ncbi:tyrosine-protein phosphatase non-receptor type 13-like, partial [Astyanax mexicanus]
VPTLSISISKSDLYSQCFGLMLMYFCVLSLVDTTRVVLGKDGGYINANFIKMLVKDESFHYIACQGPLPTTLGDFWQMVWEQKSNVIAMMTQEVEGGKVKCQRYWPDASHTAEMVGERLQITLVKDQHLENFVIRLIETNEIQRVTHLNYTGWPDHGTPTQPEQLLTFISYMRHIHQSGPIITHCSAGIGRSGTLICIDVVLGLISKDADRWVLFYENTKVNASLVKPIKYHRRQNVYLT